MDVNMVMSSIVGILAYVPVWFRASAPKSQATLVQELTTFVMNSVVATPQAAAPAAPAADQTPRPRPRRPRTAKPAVSA